jgi:hypothetical protein
VIYFKLWLTQGPAAAPEPACRQAGKPDKINKDEGKNPHTNAGAESITSVGNADGE